MNFTGPIYLKIAVEKMECMCNYFIPLFSTGSLKKMNVILKKKTLREISSSE